MFVDASAIVALLGDEPEADRISAALASASHCRTSPVAVLETVLALARPDKFDMTVEAVGPIVLEFLDARGIEICDLPPASETTALALSAAHRYRAGRHGLNLGDCLHYAAARFLGVPILATADEFRRTDLETVP
ncbi:type II toxin-antitoxin system VapC family toxin [Methylobacterium sp. J-088]|uniref:type II toxin-antitoxin system VapC family toxin n=1 Tax=Methylobacterium sp. J-088 TaxID=2836664 RepID=UPI001FBAA925|nr:type II toxin-antitoxin system VapC family toxin [Methylobacterium sp. J-088]MCJ2065620.1 type II toxin-antitoxin system VapC family toxin [Methylobacterium sp. J-088]